MSQGSEEPTLSPSEEQVLELLRTRGLSIRHLDEEQKERVREFMRHWHVEKGVSLTDIARMIGNKTSGYTSWLVRQLGIQARNFEEARLAGIHKKVRKYERKPFDGTDEDRAYLLGLRHGDLSVSRPWKGVVRVSTSTTHPAMVELFRSLFEPHGHVYQHPRYKKDTKTYEWNLSTIVDESFEFLMTGAEASWEWVAEGPSTSLAYLAGLFDAEGSVGIYRNARTTAVTTCFYNTNIDLLLFVHKCLDALGRRPTRPYLDKQKGFRSPGFHIEMKKDYWRVMVANFDESQSLLRTLPLRHREKVEKKQLALSITKGDAWDLVRGRVSSLRDSVREERVLFTREAELDFLNRHGKPPD